GVHCEPLHPLRFGYYLPGPPGPAQVQAEGLAPAGCVVGRGSASVDVQLGRVSPAVALVIGPAAGTRSDGGVLCRSSADASVDHRPTDARSADAHGSDARADSHPTDARADSHPTDARVDSHPTDAGAPMCL